MKTKFTLIPLLLMGVALSSSVVDAASSQAPSRINAQAQAQAQAQMESQARADARALAEKEIAAEAVDPVAGKPRSGLSFDELRLLPIQSGGRIKPLDSLAREIVLFETSSQKFQGWDPVDLLLSWLAYPHSWQKTQFIKIGRVDVRRQLGLEEKRTLFSPNELFSNFSLLQYAERMDREGMGGAEALTGKVDKAGAGSKNNPRETELKNLIQRISMFRDVVSGAAWTVVPQPNGKPWLSIGMTSADGPAIAAVRGQFVELVKAYQSQDAAAFTTAAIQTRELVQKEMVDWNDHQARQIGAEVFYNKVHPFQYAWIFYVLGALLWLAAPKKAGEKKSWLRNVAFSATYGAFAFHTLGIALRCYIAGRPPVTNMYESIIWVSYGTVIFASILYWVQKNSITLLVASVLATAGLIAADAAPAMMDPGLHPLMPVLRSNYWLTIHVLTITISYSAFALTLGIANVTLFNYLRGDRARAKGDLSTAQQTQMRIAGLNLLTYRAMQFGIVLLAAGTILGGVWADYSWGRFWGWDPKEVWALVALLCYTAIIHGRMTSWIGPFAFACWSIIGFLSVLMAWYGVNFVLGVGLHAYGFSSGGTAWVVGFTSFQLAYVLVVSAFHRYWQAQSTAKPLTPASV